MRKTICILLALFAVINLLSVIIDYHVSYVLNLIVVCLGFLQMFLFKSGKPK